MNHTVYKLFNIKENKWIKTGSTYNYAHHKFTDNYEEARMYTRISFAKDSIKKMKENPKDYEVHTCAVTLETKEALT